MAAGAVLTDVPLLQDALIGAGIGLMGTKILFVVMERGDVPVPEIGRRRIEMRWMLGGAGAGCIVYMLVRWLYA
jgi:hypothetical protein